MLLQAKLYQWRYSRECSYNCIISTNKKTNEKCQWQKRSQIS